MSSLTPIPPQDPGFQIAAPMDTHTGAPVPKFRLKKLVFFLRKFWWIPIITLVLTVGVAFVHFLSQPPEFISHASLWQTEKLQMDGGASFAQDEDNYFGNLLTVLQSDQVRQLALQRLAAQDKNKITYGRDGNPIPAQISGYQVSRSSVYVVEATSANPQFTTDFLNALVSVYLEYKKNVRRNVSDDTLNSIADQIAILDEDLTNDQKVLAEYERSNNLVVIQNENDAGGVYLANLKTRLADYMLESNRIETVARETNSMMILGTTNLASPLFARLEQNNSGSQPITQSQDTYQQLQSLKLQRDRLSKFLRPAHPKILKLDEQITNAEMQIDLFRRENQENIATERKANRILIDTVQQQIDEWEKTIKDDSARIAVDQTLRDNMKRNQQKFDRYLSMMDNVDISRNIQHDPLAILELASASTRSYAKLKSSISTAIFGGLALGLGIIALLAVRDDRFSSVVEVTERIGDNVVGQVPEIPGVLNGAPVALLKDNDDRHMYVESYRNLRSALLYLAVDGARPKVLMITSAIPNEGKSTIAANLARVMALGGSRVLLIDGDLRKGQLHNVHGLKIKPGLTDLLLRPEDLEKSIQASFLPNLSFIGRGSSQQNPGDLFLSNNFDQILVKLRERFDYILVDSCPVFAADDSTTLAPKMDGILFIVRSHFSRSNVVKEALELLYQRQAIVLGLILNRADASTRSYHYYKYSEYHSSTETT
jgi:capsular exopolysaccharide synthesis family protein